MALGQMLLRGFRRRDDSPIREMSVDSLRAPNLLLFTPLHRKRGVTQRLEVKTLLPESLHNLTVSCGFKHVKQQRRAQKR